MPYRIDPRTGQKINLDTTTGQPMNQGTSQSTGQNNQSSEGFNTGNFFKTQNKSAGGFAKNAVQDVTELVKGIASLPGVAKSVATGELPITDLVQTVVKGTVKEYSDLITHPIETAYNKPVSTVLNVLPFVPAGRAAKGAQAASLADDAARTGKVGKTLSAVDDVATAGKKASKIERLAQTVSENAAARITKASPTVYRNALESGIDINEVLTRYFPKKILQSAGVSDFVGDIAKGGAGGIIRKNIDEAEGVIKAAVSNKGKTVLIATDELVEPLLKQRNKLASVPGNDAKVAALDEFVESTKKLYPKGLNTEESLNLKRIYDDDFGKAVVDETRGAATASAQKMLANRARELLKKRVPQIKEALDKESELYTLRPIMNHAYAIDKTQGSLIRRGGISSVDLSKPATWFDPILSSKRASQILLHAQSLSKKIPELSGARSLGPIITGLSENGEQGVGSTEDIIDNREENMLDKNEYYKQEDGVFSDLEQENNQGTETIPQETTEDDPFGGLSKRQVLAAALKSGAAKKDLEEIAAVYDMFSSKGGVDEGTQKAASSLRSEYISQTKENRYIEVLNNYNKIKNVPNTAAGDVSLIYAYMKILDPGSVVRETEQSIAENATSLPGKFQNYAEKVISGKKLNPTQRKEFVDAAAEVFGSVKRTQDEIDGLYTSLAEDYGVDPRLVGIGRIGNR